MALISLRSGLCPVGLRLNTSRRIESARRKRSEEHTSELQSQSNLVCRLLLDKKKDQVGRDHEDITQELLRTQSVRYTTRHLLLLHPGPYILQWRLLPPALDAERPSAVAHAGQ